MVEINRVPEDIQDTQLQETICKALPLTGNDVLPEDLEACHRAKVGQWMSFPVGKREFSHF